MSRIEPIKYIFKKKEIETFLDSFHFKMQTPETF